ncbi:TATA-binding protein-associated factor 2N [Sitophilus oryzae]|uniref:TATA-binding protein-associated factor 2N n=1 Tax=Sitophilus oryzae TaxID=7048 RepID=A0A6J2YE75_SITOR|nr:TATA-binding protein-associated factor 2N [Sitophilus oryzae]
MLVNRNSNLICTIPFILTFHLVQSTTLKDVFSSLPQSTQNIELDIVRVPRKAEVNPEDGATFTEHIEIPVDESESTIIRKARDSSKYYSDRFGASTKTNVRSLKPEDNTDDGRNVKGNGSLEKRCTTCDTGYLRSSTYGGGDRYRDRYDKYYERDPYSRYEKYDPYERYDRYERERYPYDRYDDYDRDSYRDNRGRNRYSSYVDRYEPRERYYDRGLGYDNRGYDYRDYGDYRNSYSPYSRERHDGYYSPSEDLYSRGGGGYDSVSRSNYGRPEYGNGGYYGYARGYSYGGDRDRYGVGYGSYRAKNPYDYDNGYRPTSYLYDRPSSTTTDMPKLSDSDMNTPSPSQSSSSGRS